MTKKLTSLALALVMCLSLCVPAFADEHPRSNSDENEVIVLDTMEAIEEMRRNDRAAYEARLNSVDENLTGDVQKFLVENQEFSLLENSINRNNAVAINNEEFLEAFLEAYPEYSGMDQIQLAADVELLRFNPVAGAVQLYFSQKGYDLAYEMFTHSLLDNPSNVAYTLNGNTGVMFTHLRYTLTNDPFLDKMITFANKNNSFESVIDSSYAFNDGDLFWAIHGFTWTRNRTQLGRATFAIDDVYDFNKWQDIPGIVAGVCDTHDFNIYIGGYVLNGVIG